MQSKNMKEVFKMKMNAYRLLSVILSLCMIICIFAGCSDKETVSEVTSDDNDIVEMDDVDVDLGLNGEGDSDTDGSGKSSGKSGNGSGGSSKNSISGITNVDNDDIFKNIPANLKGTTVTIAHWGDEGATEYVKVQKQFTKDTKIKVKWMLLSQSDYISSIVKQIAAGTGPDIVICNNTFPTALEAVQPLPSSFNVNDGFWDKRVCDAMSVGGKYYFVNSYSSPFTGGTVVYYNKKIFADNGLTTPDDYVAQGNWSYEMLTKCMQQVAKIGKAGGIIESMTLAQQMGASMITYDSAKKAFSGNPNNENLVSAIQWMTQCVAEGIAGGYSVNDFASGQVGICMAGTYGMKFNGYFKDVSPSQIGVVPLPTSYKGKKLDYMPLGLRGYGIAKNSKNPEGAYYFLRYFLDFEKYDDAGANIFANKVMEKYFVKTILPNFRNQKLYFEYYNCVLPLIGKGWSTNDWTQVRHSSSGQVAVELSKMTNVCVNAANEANAKLKSFAN